MQKLIDLNENRIMLTDELREYQIKQGKKVLMSG